MIQPKVILRARLGGHAGALAHEGASASCAAPPPVRHRRCSCRPFIPRPLRNPGAEYRRMAWDDLKLAKREYDDREPADASRIADVVFDFRFPIPFPTACPTATSHARTARARAAARRAARRARGGGSGGADAGLKALTAVVDAHPCSPRAARAARWIAAQSLSTLGSTCAGVVPPPADGVGVPASTAPARSGERPALFTGHGRERRLLERIAATSVASVVLVPDLDAAARWATRLGAGRRRAARPGAEDDRACRRVARARGRASTGGGGNAFGAARAAAPPAACSLS